MLRALNQLSHRLGLLEAPHGEQDLPETSQASLNTLSDELALTIQSFLSPQDLAVLGQVDRRWRRLTSDPLMWRTRIQTDLPAVRLPAQPEVNWKRHYLENMPGLDGARVRCLQCTAPGLTLETWNREQQAVPITRSASFGTLQGELGVRINRHSRHYIEFILPNDDQNRAVRLFWGGNRASEAEPNETIGFSDSHYIRCANAAHIHILDDSRFLGWQRSFSAIFEEPGVRWGFLKYNPEGLQNRIQAFWDSPRNPPPIGT